MFYDSLVSSIPQKWKISLKNSQKISNINRTGDEVGLKINGKFRPISKITSKMIDVSLIKKSFKTPVAISICINLFPFLENHNWADTFNLPFKTLKEIYLQSFQYKILNRILNCNYNLHKRE